jgi:hypothetical protein
MNKTWESSIRDEKHVRWAVKVGDKYRTDCQHFSVGSFFQARLYKTKTAAEKRARSCHAFVQRHGRTDPVEVVVVHVSLHTGVSQHVPD